MSETLQARIAAAYRWHNRLGANGCETPLGHYVADPEHPGVWERNFVDDIRARDASEIETVFAEMETRFAHSDWRVVETDGFTPEAFLARLAFEDYVERFTTIRMALDGPAAVAAAVAPDPVESEADWAALADLVRANHAEGHTTNGVVVPEAVTRGIVAGYRLRAPACRFHFVREGGAAIAYGSASAAPNGVGVVEDLFTAPTHRRKGVASALIGALAEDLRRRGCAPVVIGALANEAPKRLYRRLGFQPVALARKWVKSVR